MTTDKSTNLRTEIDQLLATYREATIAIDTLSLAGEGNLGIQAELESLQRRAKMAKDRLVVANKGLIKAVAKNVLGAAARNPENLVEAEQEGALGVMRAVDAYDPDRGLWSVCARYWIRYYVQTCAHRQTDFPKQRYQRMPPEVVRQANAVRTQKGREPVYTDVTHNGVAVTEEDWLAWNTRTHVTSYDGMQQGGGDGEEGGGYGHQDLIADPSTNPELTVADAHLRERIEDAMAKMSPRNADIIRAHFIDGDPIDEVAKRFRVSETRVHEVKKMLAERLRKMLVTK